jgi:glyceraldehyde-3-phosphate dehydrogenase (NADP+)
MKIEKYFVAGEWRASRRAFEVFNPYNGEITAKVAGPSPVDVESAIASAAAAFEHWKKSPLFKREDILLKIRALILEKKEDLARTIVLECGKPLKAARVEVERAAGIFLDAAACLRSFGGELLPIDFNPSAAGRTAIVKRFPIGPIAAITPFNFPLMLVAHKLAPAIAAGCTMVLKPASATPLSALRLAEIAEQAGLEGGVLNVLPICGADSAPLVEDPRLKALTFTGSPQVGWTLKQQAWKKRVSLELGGNAGCIVHEDADVKYAAKRCAFGGYAQAGQSCIHLQRIFIHEKIYDAFLAEFLPRVKALAYGDPMDEKTDVGPLITPTDCDRVYRWISEAKGIGVKLLLGGGRVGNVLEPAVLENVPHSANAWRMEIFGPVTTVEPYKDFADALKMVNESEYGLQAGVFTRDAGRIWTAFEELEVGGVVAGDVPTFRADNQPYGGVKESGFGREGVRYAMEEMTEPKVLILNLGV